MRKHRTGCDAQNGRMRGFTTVELAVTLALILVVSAIALPSFMRSYQSYQVTDAATRMANILKSTRYEAIRLNTPINCVTQAGPNGTTIVGADSDRSGAIGPRERQTQFTATVTLIPAAGVPGTGALTGAAGFGPLNALPTPIAFDGRGAVNPPGVYVAYVGYVATPTAGYRAVILLPSGSIQVWSGDQAGNWHALD